MCKDWVHHSNPCVIHHASHGVAEPEPAIGNARSGWGWIVFLCIVLILATWPELSMSGYFVSSGVLFWRSDLRMIRSMAFRFRL